MKNKIYIAVAIISCTYNSLTQTSSAESSSSSSSQAIEKRKSDYLKGQSLLNNFIQKMNDSEKLSVNERINLSVQLSPVAFDSLEQNPNILRGVLTECYLKARTIRDDNVKIRNLEKQVELYQTPYEDSKTKLKTAQSIIDAIKGQSTIEGVRKIVRETCGIAPRESNPPQYIWTDSQKYLTGEEARIYLTPAQYNEVKRTYE